MADLAALKSSSAGKFSWVGPAPDGGARFCNEDQAFYKCQKCEYTFLTSIRGIIGHLDAHENGSFTEIGVSKNVNNSDGSAVFRPKQ